MQSNVNVPEELMPYFVNAAGIVDLEKVAIFISTALNAGLERPVYGAIVTQGGLDLYQQQVPRGQFLRLIIGRVTVVLTPQFRYFGFFGNTNEWYENGIYFGQKVTAKINALLAQIHRQKRHFIALGIRDRLSELKGNPFYEDRNSTIQVMQYLGIHKPKPKNFLDFSFMKPQSPPKKAGDKRGRES